MAGIVKLSEVKFDEPSGIVPLSAIKFDDDEGAWEGFVKPTLKAIPRVVGHTVASMAQMPVSGIAAGAKFISSKGDITAANKVLEDNQQALDNAYLTTDAERQGAANIGLAMKPFQMAGEGLQEIVKLTPLEGTIAEPIAGTVGEASAMFGLGGAGKAIKARANKSMGVLRDVIEPIKTDIVIKPQKIVRLEDVKFDEPIPKTEPKIVPLESVKIDEVSPEVKAEVKPIEEKSITAEDFELHPDRMENLKKGFVAFQVDGKTISAKIGSKVNGQEVYNHADLGVAKGLDFDTAVPGFLDKEGRFVEQYPTVKTVADRPSGETVGVSPEKTLPARPAVSNLPSAETVTPPVEKPVVAREDVTKSIYEKENPLAINDPLYDALEALTNKSNRRGYNPDLLTEDNIAQLKKNGFVVGGAKSLKVTVKGRSYLDEVGKNKKEIDTAFANEQDILADKAVEAFDKTQVKTPEPTKETKVIPTTKKAEANVTSPKEQKTYVLDKVDGLITEARARWKDEYGSKHPDKEIDEKMLKGTFGDDTAKLRGLEPTIVIEVPNDGRYKIPNTLNALLTFKRKFKMVETTTEVPDFKSPMPSKKPTGKPLEQIEKEAFEEHQRYLDMKSGTKADYENYTGKWQESAQQEYEKWVKIDEDVDSKKITLKSLSEEFRGKVPSGKDLSDKVRDARQAVSDNIKRGNEIKETIKNNYPSMYKEMFGKKEPKGVQLNSGLDPTQIIDIMKTVSAKTSEIIEANKMTPSVARGVKAAKDAMIEQDRNVRRAESTSKLFEKTVQDIVPKPERQMEMVHAYEHKMKGKAWDGLTEIEKGVVRWVAEEKAKLNKYIKDNDILETMPESDSINHIFHHWIDKETGKPYKAMYGKFSKGLPQAKQRVIPTYEAGIKNGMTPATTNIGKLIGMEWESVTRANNARQLFKKLHGIKGDESMSIVLSKGGKPQPIRMVESWSALEKQGLTDGYVRYENNFLDKAMTFESSDGRLITMKGAVGVKEELYPFVHAYIDNPQYGKLSELNFASKSLTLGASLFHPMSLGMQQLANIFGARQIPFATIPKGLRLAKELGPEVRLLHQEGLELFKGYEDLGFKNQFFDDGATLGKVGNAVTWPITKMRDFIFDYVQPGMKVSFAHAMFTKLLPEYLKNTKYTAEEVMAMYETGKALPPEALQCAREVVQKADGHFSGEHYKRSLLETNRFMVKLYFTPEARVKWQAALLSPTWQREHLLVAKNVVKSFMPDKMIKKLGMAELGPIKSQYRLYALGAVMIIGAVDLWNYNASLIMDGEGKHLWQNPTGKGFAVRAWWNEPAYTIQDKNGRYKYIPAAPAYIRPLKSVFEVAEWAHDPVLKLGYKLSPVVSAVGEQLFGQKKYVGLPDIPERAWDFVIDSTTPIVVDQAIRTAQGKQSIQATALPFIGMPVSRLKQMNYKSNPEGN